ncbi:MAG TPA: hypothetical protein VLR90_06610 [Blastocatellia bacterium]|nr:hypothetical protein [Blastocatellia bacterium]
MRRIKRSGKRFELKREDLVLIDDGSVEVATDEEWQIEITLNHESSEPLELYYKSATALRNQLQAAGMRPAIKNPTDLATLTIAIWVGAIAVKRLTELLSVYLNGRNGRTISVKMRGVTVQANGISPSKFTKMLKQTQGTPAKPEGKPTTRSSRKKVIPARSTLKNKKHQPKRQSI